MPLLESRVTTVLGPLAEDRFGLTDAHTHLWIDAVAGAADGSPVLDREAGILAELEEYRSLGGSAAIDCQPGGCGRNGTALVRLARASGVHVVACTGFHRARYYPADYWLWKASPEEAAAYFLAELEDGLAETRTQATPTRAGFIKIACEARLSQTPQAALEGAALAAARSQAAIEIHTERGAEAEAILEYFTRRGVSPTRLVLCHMDKRPDSGLHGELAMAGVVLEYDTFYRPQYLPDETVWPLIGEMLADGYERSIALATDMADAAMWKHLGGGAGMPGLVTAIRPRLKASGVTDAQIALLMGQNIIRTLAKPGSQAT